LQTAAQASQERSQASMSSLTRARMRHASTERGSEKTESSAISAVNDYALDKSHAK
jgi:hypothetical protein